MPAACQQTLNGIYQAIKAKVNHWSARGLYFLGRVHVAKQGVGSLAVVSCHLLEALRPVVEADQPTAP